MVADCWLLGGWLGRTNHFKIWKILGLVAGVGKSDHGRPTMNKSGRSTLGSKMGDQSRPTIQYFTSSYTSCGTLSPDPHTATVVIKLVVMTSSSFLFSFLISSAFSAIQHEVSDIHRDLTCNMQYYNIQ